MTGMLMEISLNDLYVDPRSRAKCLFVKQIRKKIIIILSLMSTTYLWLHSSIRTTTTTITKFEQSRCDVSGVTIHIQEKMTHVKG